MCAAHSGLGISFAWFSFMTPTLEGGEPGAYGVGCQPMSRTRQNQDHAVVVATFPMSPGTVFSWHTHDDHQLAWAAQGVLTVITETGTWVLPPTRALWIPAGLPHETGAWGQATMRSVYVSPGLSPVDWAVPTVIAASPLLAEVIGYLGGELTAARRAPRAAGLRALPTPLPAM